MKARTGFTGDVGCAVSTVIAILRALGTECSQEFAEIHSNAAHLQLESFYVGKLLQ